MTQLHPYREDPGFASWGLSKHPQYAHICAHDPGQLRMEMDYGITMLLEMPESFFLSWKK